MANGDVFYTNPIKYLEELYKFADANPKADLQAHVLENIEKLAGKASKSNLAEKETIITKTKIAKGMIPDNAALRSELAESRLALNTLLKDTDLENRIKTAKDSELFKDAGASILKQAQAIFTYVRHGETADEVRKNNLAADLIFNSDGTIAVIGQMANFETVVGIAEQSKLLTQAAAKAQEHTPALKGVVILEPIKRGTPLAGTANQENDIAELSIKQ